MTLAERVNSLKKSLISHFLLRQVILRLASAYFLSLNLNVSYAQTYKFNANMLDKEVSEVDLSFFNNGTQKPGAYLVDVYINEIFVEQSEMVFFNTKNNGEHHLYPCMKRVFLLRHGISHNSLTSDPDISCFDFNIIPNSRIEYDYYNQELKIFIPQYYIDHNKNRAIDYSMWDPGINAVFFSHYSNLLLEKEKNNNYRDENAAYFSRVEAGANYDYLRFRSNLSMDYGKYQKKTQIINSFIFMPIPKIKGIVYAGDNLSNGDIFESFSYRGIELRSNELMLPDSDSAFSPAVKGRVENDANIEITQNGYVIHKEFLSAGEYEIKNFNNSIGKSGVLNVTIKEINGKSESFSIPYHTPVISVKKEYIKHSHIIGDATSISPDRGSERFISSTMVYGLTSISSIYSGYIISGGYHSYVLGTGLSLASLGAASFDIKKSTSNIEGSRFSGDNFSLRYKNEFSSNNISFDYDKKLNREYMAFPEYVSNLCNPLTINCYTNSTHSTFVFNINKETGSNGLLSAAISKRVDYNYNASTYSASYSRTFNNKYSSSLYLSHNITRNTHNNTVIGISISIPFKSEMPEVWMKTLNTNHYINSNKSTSNEATLNINNNTDLSNYSLRVRDDKSREGINKRILHTSVKPDEKKNFPTFDFYHEKKHNIINLNSTGSIVIHDEGITLGSLHGDTNALVKAPGAKGIPINGQKNNITNNKGFGLVSGLSSYQVNNLSLSPVTEQDDIEILQTDIKVTPVEGAIVKANFNTLQGDKAIIKINRGNNSVPPMGAIVSLENNNYITGIVDDSGSVYLNGLPKNGEITVSWGAGNCKALYTISGDKNQAGIYSAEVLCK